MTPAVAWMHPFERAGLGRAPFYVVGYAVERYQAHPDAPAQCGATCDRCGTGIMHVYRVMSDDGRCSKVGCDCIQRTEDTALIESRRNAERREQRERWSEQARAAAGARERGRIAQAAHNLEHAAMLVEGAAVVAESANASEYERRIAETVRRELSDGSRALGVTVWEWAIIAAGYRAAMLPESRHVGAVGARLRGVSATYEGGPTIDGGQWGPSVLGRFRTDDGAVLVWKTMHHCARRGATVRLTGTVKAHKDYRGVLQTWMTRCKVDILEDGPETER